MPAKPRPPRPNNIAYSVHVDTIEYCVLQNEKVVRIDPLTGEQSQLSRSELDAIMAGSRESHRILAQERRQEHHPARFKSQEILARADREKSKAR